MRTLSTPVPALVERLLDQLTDLRWFLTRIMPGARGRRIETKLDQLAEQLGEQFARRSIMNGQEHHLTRLIALREQGVFDRHPGAELFTALWSNVVDLPAEVARVLITQHGDQMKRGDQATPGTTTANDGGAA